jgi:hypothetical protein
MMRRLVMACAALAATIAIASTPVAFVTDTQGAATIAGGAKVSMLAELAPATKIVLDKGARVSVMYAASGAEFTMTGPGEFLIEETEAKAIKGAAPSRRNVVKLGDPGVVARVSQSATASLRMRSLSGAPPSKPGLAYPVNAKIATLQPQLRWVGEAGPAGFAIVVLGADGKEAWKGTSKSRAHVLPAKLAAGARYTWSVSVDGKSLGEAPFETLPSEAIARAEKSRTGAKSFPDRVMHAFVLQDLGAAQDAREAWAALSLERPDLPELAVLAR